MPRIHRALLSVSDKRGLLDFARVLVSLDIEIISTGGTHTLLQEHGIRSRSVSEITSFPEILAGRVKTLHPAIHAGLLSNDDNKDHHRQIEQLGIRPIELVVVNLYPFNETVAREGVSLEEAVEQIDIGGPTMLRAAAKNFRHRAVVVSPDHYPGSSTSCVVVRDGKLRGIAVTSAKRTSIMPEMPTIAESGIAVYEVGNWYEIVAPARTPDAVVARLHGEIVKVLGTAEMKKRLVELGADPVGSTPEELARYQQAELAKWAKVVKSAGIRPE